MYVVVLIDLEVYLCVFSIIVVKVRLVGKVIFRLVELLCISFGWKLSVLMVLVLLVMLWYFFSVVES